MDLKIFYIFRKSDINTYNSLLANSVKASINSRTVKDSIGVNETDQRQIDLTASKTHRRCPMWWSTAICATRRLLVWQAMAILHFDEKLHCTSIYIYTYTLTQTLLFNIYHISVYIVYVSEERRKLRQGMKAKDAKKKKIENDVVG